MHFPADRMLPSDSSCHCCAAEPSHVAWNSCIPSVPSPLLRHFAEAATTRAWPAGAADEPDPLFVAGLSSPGSVSGSPCPAWGVDSCDGVCAVGDVTLELGELDGEGTEEGVSVSAGCAVVVPPAGSGRTTLRRRWCSSPSSC